MAAPRAGRAAARDFPRRAKPEINSKEQPCHTKENPVHPYSFTWIYTLFKIGPYASVEAMRSMNLSKV